MTKLCGCGLQFLVRGSIVDVLVVIVLRGAEGDKSLCEISEEKTHERLTAE